MLSLLSIITLLPLVVSAARIPHHVLDLDASLVSDTKSTVDLDLVPRSPLINNIPIVSDVVNNVPIVSNVVNTVTQLLPDITAGVSFCVTLAADTTLEIDGNFAFLAAGTCLCVDAGVGINSGITVEASTGQTFSGALAFKLRNSIINVLQGSPLSGPNYFTLTVGADVCLQLDLFIAFTQHDFSPNVQGPNRCCARSCIAPYVPGPGKSCVCPPANLCGGKCYNGPTITCSGTCYLESEYTCPSNNPNPVPRDKIEKAVPRRRSEIPFGRCSFGQELCAVATSAGYECVNTISDMESCGGCVHSFRGTGKQGQDCTAIPNVNEVMCNQGQCQVVTCEAGYRAANNATICVSESRLDNALKQSTSLLIQGLTH